MSEKALSYIEQMHRNEMRRLFRAKMRLASFCYATGGWGHDRYDPQRNLTGAEQAAYGLLLSKLSRELNDAYRDVVRSGVLAGDKTAIKEAMEHRFAEGVHIMDMFHIDHAVGSYLTTDEEAFRAELRERMEAL